MRLKKRLGGVSILRREATKPAFVKLITPQRRRISGRRQDGYRTRHAPCRRPLPRVPPGKSVLPERAGNAGEVRGARALEATVFERLRCNACGQIFKADPSDVAGPEKYEETAVAMIALLKYGTGAPFQRLERLRQQLGMPLPAATQWDLMTAAAELIRPVQEELIRQAAQGSILHNDDRECGFCA